jgi:hypothetical protein
MAIVHLSGFTGTVRSIQITKHLYHCGMTNSAPYAHVPGVREHLITPCLLLAHAWPAGQPRGNIRVPLRCNARLWSVL